MAGYYFYLWRHPYTGMTCYGITGDHEHRKRKYEGHNGFDVNWSYLIEANEPTIRELEKRLKSLIAAKGYGFRGYEWIISDVTYDTIEQVLETFLQGQTYNKLI